MVAWVVHVSVQEQDAHTEKTVTVAEKMIPSTSNSKPCVAWKRVSQRYTLVTSWVLWDQTQAHE